MSVSFVKVTLRNRMIAVLDLYKVTGFEIGREAGTVRWLADKTGSSVEQVAAEFQNMLDAGQLKQVGMFGNNEQYSLDIPVMNRR